MADTINSKINKVMVSMMCKQGKDKLEHQEKQSWPDTERVSYISNKRCRCLLSLICILCMLMAEHKKFLMHF